MRRTSNEPPALWRCGYVCLWCSFIYFQLTYVDRKSHGKTWGFWDKNPLKSSDILSKALFIENHEVVVKCLGYSMYKEVKIWNCVLLFSRARFVAQNTVREFMPWGGGCEWGRKDAILMTYGLCFNSILRGVFGNEGLCNANEYNYIPLKKEEKIKPTITCVGMCNRSASKWLWTTILLNQHMLMPENLGSVLRNRSAGPAVDII